MKGRFFDEYAASGADSDNSFSEGSDDDKAPKPLARVPVAPPEPAQSSRPSSARAFTIRAAAKQADGSNKKSPDASMERQLKVLAQSIQRSSTNSAGRPDRVVGNQSTAPPTSATQNRSRLVGTAGLSPVTVSRGGSWGGSPNSLPKKSPTLTKKAASDKTLDLDPRSKDTLTIRVVQGTSILPDDGETPDPYAVLRFGNETRITEAVEQSSNPDWEQEFTFPLPAMDESKLTVTVFDFNGDGTAPYLIGEGELLISSQAPPNQWRAAAVTLRNNNNTCGKVVLKFMRVTPNITSSSSVPQTTLRRKGDPPLSSLPASSTSASASRKPRQPLTTSRVPAATAPAKKISSSAFEEGVIKIRVVEGRHMRMRGENETSSLFVVASLGEEERQTQTVPASRGSAKWDEDIEIEFAGGAAQELWFEIFHSDEDEDEAIPSGCFSLPVPSKELTAAAGAHSKPKWYPMKSSFKYGELCLSVQYVPRSALAKKAAAPNAAARPGRLAPAPKKDPFAKVDYEIDDDLIAQSEELFDNCLKHRGVWREEVRLFLIFSERFFTGGTTIVDQSGYGNDAKLVGRALFKTVDLPEEPNFLFEDSALELDLATHLVLPILPSLDFDKQVTIEAWLKPYSLNGGFVTLLSHDGGFPIFKENKLQCGLWLKGKSKLAKLEIPLFGEEVPDELYDAFGDQDTFTKHWHHYALTYDGKKVQLYIDAVCVGQRSVDGDRLELVPLGGEFAIGKSNNLHYQDYHGQIAALRISSVALEKTELEEMMQLGTFGALDLPDEETKLGTLRVTVVRGSRFDLLGKKPPNAYVECFVGSQSKSTRVIAGSATPEWKDELDFDIYEESEVVVIHAWHHDPKRPITLGSATISATPDTRRNHRSERRVNMGGKNNSEVLVQLTYTPIRRTEPLAERELRPTTSEASARPARSKEAHTKLPSVKEQPPTKERRPERAKDNAKEKDKPARTGRHQEPTNKEDLEELVALLGEDLEGVALQIAKARKTKRDLLDASTLSPNSSAWLEDFGVTNPDDRDDVQFRLNQLRKRAPQTDVLRLKVISGSNLKDVAVVKSKDFYVQATLLSTSNTLCTATIKGDSNPVWDTMLDFDVTKWKEKGADKESFLFQDELKIEIRSSHGFGDGSVAGLTFSLPDCPLLMANQPLRRVARFGSNNQMEVAFELQYIPLNGKVSCEGTRLQTPSEHPDKKAIVAPWLRMFLVCSDKFSLWTADTLLDQSGHGNNGTLDNVKWAHVGEAGRSLDIKGHFFGAFSDSLLTVPYTPSLKLEQDFTCEVWANGNGDGVFTQDGLVSFPIINEDMISGYLCLTDQPDFNFEVEVKDLEGWHHYALTFDGLAVAVYVDAKIVFTQSIMSQSKVSPKSPQTDAVIGNRFSGDVGGVQLSAICKTSDQILYSMMSLSDLIRKHKFLPSASKFKGVVQVNVVEGIDLSCKDKVLTKVWLGKESKQTKALSASSPVWNQEFRFEMPTVPDLLHFEIMSLGSMMSDKKRGSASIPIPGDEILDFVGQKHEMIVSLGEEKQGRLKVELTFTPFVSIEHLQAERSRAKSIQEEATARLHEEQLAATHRLKSIQSSFFVEEGQDVEFFDVEPYSSYLFVPGTMHVTVRKVENLVSKRLFSHKVSPFLKVLCGSEERTSAVKKNEDNPVFDHECSFEIRSATQIKFQVWDDGKRGSPLGRCSAMMPDQALLQSPNTVFSRVLSWGTAGARLLAEVMYVLDPTQADINKNQKNPVSCDEFTSLFVVATDRFFDQRNSRITDCSNYGHSVTVRCENSSELWEQVHQNQLVTIPFALGVQEGDRTCIEVAAKSNRLASARFTHELWALVDGDNVGCIASTSEGVAFPKIEGKTLSASIELVSGREFVVSTKLPDSWVRGQWHHYALTFDGITACLYLNGELIHSQSATEGSDAKVSDAKSFDAAPSRIVIGRSATTNFSGIIGGYRISSTPRTKQWIAAHFCDLHGEKQCNITNSDSPALGSLQVKLIRGESLVIRDISTRSSDPYVKLTLDGEQLQQSEYVKKNLNPEWNEEFRFNVHQTPCVLSLHVWDKDFIGSDDDMGEARLHVPSDEMLQSIGKQLVVQEVPINGGKNGKLFVGLSWVPVDTKPPLPPAHEVPTPKQTRTTRPTSTSESGSRPTPRSARPTSLRAAGPIVPEAPPKKEVTRDTTGTIVLKVKRGKDLVARDVSGTSDPYVIVSVDGVEKQTRHISRTLNPEWNEEFRFSVDRVGFVDVSLFDYNKFTSHRAMGKAQCELPMTLLETPGAEVDWWQSFEKPKYGQVLLSATFLPAKSE